MSEVKCDVLFEMIKKEVIVIGVGIIEYDVID